MKECIIIGTSPLAIVEAAYLNSKGYKTLNIESKNEISGAWTTIKYKDFPEIEIGSHIWSYNKKTYLLIQNLFEIPIAKLDYQPKILFKNLLIPYDWKMNLLSIKSVSSNLFKFNFKFFKSIKTYPDIRFSILTSAYMYPKNGAIDIKKALETFIKKHELKIDLNKKVKSISISRESIEVLMLDEGKYYCSKHLILTSLSEIEQITLENGEEIKLPKKEIQYIHRHLLIKDNKKPKFNYIRCVSDKVIHRLSDMTSQVKNHLKKNEIVICAGIFHEQFESLKTFEQEEYIMKYLKRHKLISNTASLLKSDSNVYPSFYNDSELMKEIEQKSNGKIKFLRSTDFIYSFYNNYDKYITLI